MTRFVQIAAVCLGMVFTTLPLAAQSQKPSAQSQKPAAQSQKPPAPPAPKTVKPSTAIEPSGVPPPAGYVIGADDLLAVRFWGDAQMSVDVVVRPDGKISVPLINDVQAAGLTPEDLSVALKKAATKYIAEPDATVIVREIRSRKVYVIGQVNRQGSIPLNTDMNVLQVLSAAGGLLEYADKDEILIIRKESGRERRFKFSFNEVVRGKNLQQNILLQPNDTVLVH